MTACQLFFMRRCAPLYLVKINCSRTGDTNSVKYAKTRLDSLLFSNDFVHL